MFVCRYKRIRYCVICQKNVIVNHVYKCICIEPIFVIINLFFSIPVHSNNKFQLFNGLQINYLSTTSSINYRMYAANVLGVLIQV